MVERVLAKDEVVGSKPIARSKASVTVSLGRSPPTRCPSTDFEVASLALWRHCLSLSLLKYRRIGSSAARIVVRRQHVAYARPPSCPKCRRPMTLRTARRGSNRGSRFWGCPAYRSSPSCTGTRDVGAVYNEPSVEHAIKHAITGSRDSEEDFGPGEVGNGPFSAGNVSRGERAITSVSVEWTEGVPRRSFNYEYAPIGSVPGVLIAQADITDDVERLLSHTLLLTSKSRRRVEATEHARIVSGLLAKLLQRGYAPLTTLEIERAALNCHGLMKEATDLAEGEVEVGWQFPPEKARRDAAGELRKELIRRDAYVVDIGSKHSLLQSDAEVEFLTRWVPFNLGLHAAHWFTPQAPLDRLLESANLEHGG